MLRSFNYAAYTAASHITAEQSEDSVQVETVIHEWETEVARTFLQSYEAHVRIAGIYSDWDQARGLLRLFMLEKAFYELRYELNNRPSWARIPLMGISSLLE